MGLHISLDTPSRPVMVADRALWADADGKIVSGEDHPDAAQLVAGAGQPIPHDVADRYGLVVQGKSVVQQRDKPKAKPTQQRASQQRQAAANPNIPHVHHDDKGAAAVADDKNAGGAKQATPENTKEAAPTQTKGAAGNGGGGRRRPASS